MARKRLGLVREQEIRGKGAARGNGEITGWRLLFVVLVGGVDF
jgi:hypothetical protein